MNVLCVVDQLLSVYFICFRSRLLSEIKAEIRSETCSVAIRMYLRNNEC